MAYQVSSWFVDQLALKSSEPRRVFTIGGSDYSGRVMRWPTIKRSWDEVRPQSITIELANEDGNLNFIQTDKTNLAKNCSVQFGFTHPSSGDELITMYSGKMDKVRFAGGALSITLLDKFKQLTERVMGTRDAPVTFTDSDLPSDIAWAAVTSFGGYSAIESTSNPDIDYQSWLDWAAVFSADSVYMNAYVEGKKVADVLKRISRYTQSAIYIEDDRIAFKRFSMADSNQSTLDHTTLLDLSLSIGDEDIVNKQYVYGAYNVDSRDWGIQVSDVVSTSVNTYGLREQIEKDDVIWYVSSTAAINLAQKITTMAGEPYDRLNISAPAVVALRQVGETITVVDSFHSINGGYRVMDYSLNLDKMTYEANIDRSQYLLPFTLDVSLLDGTDVLL